jgi:hypothetical protein
MKAATLIYYIRHIFEVLGAIVTLFGLIQLGEWIAGKLKSASPANRLDHRLQLKKELIQNLPRRDQYGTRGDAIVQDIARLDQYPAAPGGDIGISAWFKVEVKDIYVSGLEVFIEPPVHVTRSKRSGEWVECHDDSDPERILAYAVGRIPYDKIVRIDWDGDGHYRGPHIFCRFDGIAGGPYEDIPYYGKQGNGDWLYEIDGYRPANRSKLRFRLLCLWNALKHRRLRRH